MVDNFANLATTALDGAINDSETELTVDDSSLFPAAPFVVRIDDEFLRVTEVDGVTWTVERGIEGSEPTEHGAGADVSNVVTAGWLNQVSGSAPITSMTVLDEDGFRWEATLTQGGAWNTIPDAPELVSITENGSDTTIEYPEGWTDGDLLIVCASRQHNVTSDEILIDGFDTLRTNSISLVRTAMLYRYITAADTPEFIVETSGNHQTVSVLFRNATFLSDPPYQNGSGDGTLASIPGVGPSAYSLLMGANYNSISIPGITSLDDYEQDWIVTHGDTRQRGYVTHIAITAHEIDIAWPGNIAHYIQAVIVSPSHPKGV